MPIYSPTGFLDITNATLRTSNLEAQNFRLNGGNIYVTSELTTDELLNLDNVVNAGNATSNTVQFTNLTTGLVADSNIVVTGNVTAGSFLGDGSGLTSIPPSAITGTLSQWSDGTNSDVYITSNVGIGNVHTLTSNTLQVGANLYVRDADANVLTVTGNVAADYFEGDGSKLTGISSNLEQIANNGNVTSNTVQFTNATTGFVTTSNIEVGGALKINTITAAAYHSLQAVTNVGNVTSNTVQFSNATTGLVTTGNVEVGRDLSVTGNLTVLGTRTIVDTDTLRVKDPIIELGKDNPGTGDLGLVMTRPSGSSNVAMIFNESTDTLEIGYTQSNASDTDITMRTAATEPLDVNVNGNVSVGKELTVSGNVAVDTDTLFVDSVNDRVGVGTTSPSDKLHIYGSPMIQHDTVYDTVDTPGWYKIGEWDPTNNTGARLKISFLGGNGYSSGLKARGGETILYATCNNNSPSNKANIEGMIHAYGNAVVTQVKFKHLDNSRHKFEIRAFVESYSQMAMKIECTQTDTFTKYFTSSTDLGAETVDISHAIFTHEFDNDGSLLIGTTSPHYSQRFQVSGGHSRFESGPYSRSQGKRYNYNFQTSGNNNHTLTIPINGASSRGIMKLKINVIQVAANASGAEIAELEGYISAYGGTHGITATKAVKVDSIYAEYICNTNATSTGNLKIYYRPREGYLQDVSVMFDIELQLGASFAHAGSLSHVLSSSNVGLATTPTFNTTRYEIDGYVSIPVSLSFDGTNWITVTSGGSHLGTGTWIVQAYIHSAGSAGSGQLYDETYSGIFTWYSGVTNSTVVNDIALHNAGHAPNGEVISMRTRRTGVGGVNLIFEIKSNQSWGGTARTTYFAFRRLL